MDDYLPDDSLTTVPLILESGQAWPDNVRRITPRTYAHIIDEHSPDSKSRKPLFKPDTDIGYAIFDTVTMGEILIDEPDYQERQLVINGQNIIAPLRPNEIGGEKWFVPTVYPDKDDS